MIEKQGKPKKIEGLGWHYSHSKGRTVYGHCLATSHYRRGDVSFPYDFRFYLNERERVASESGKVFKTKPDIACELIEKFESFRDEKIYCLVDSWYTSEKVVKAAKSREFELIGALKSNRVFQFTEHGKKHKLSTYVKNLRNTSFEETELKGEGPYAADGKVHFCQPPGCLVAFLPVNGYIVDFALVLGHKFFRLHKHAAGTAAGVEYAAFIGLKHFHKKFNNTARRIELSALFAFGESEFTEEIFKYMAENISDGLLPAPFGRGPGARA